MADDSGPPRREQTADHFSPAERAQFDAQTAAAKAVRDWLDGDEHRALINCTPAMISQVAVNAYRKALAESDPQQIPAHLRQLADRAAEAGRIGRALDHALREIADGADQ